MGTKVYIVWYTQEDEDGIAGVFSTSEKADEYISHSAAYHNRMRKEEYLIDGEEPDMRLKRYAVTFLIEKGRDPVRGDTIVYCIGVCGKDSIPINAVRYGFLRREFIVYAFTNEEAIELAKKKFAYVEEHRENFLYLGKKCRFRYTDKLKLYEYVDSYPEYDIDSGAIIMPHGALEFIGPTSFEEMS